MWAGFLLAVRHGSARRRGQPIVQQNRAIQLMSLGWNLPLTAVYNRPHGNHRSTKHRRHPRR